MSTDEVLLQFTLAKFDDLFAIIGAMDDEAANTRPDLAGANSAYAIGSHVLGMMRAWSGAANRGLDIPRDRDAEFTAPGAVADLLARAARVREAFVADVRAVDGDAAPTKQREDAKFWEATCHGVLLHVFEEVCQHLGHLEITRDAVTAGRPAS